MTCGDNPEEGRTLHAWLVCMRLFGRWAVQSTQEAEWVANAIAERARADGIAVHIEHVAVQLSEDVYDPRR